MQLSNEKTINVDSIAKGGCASRAAHLGIYSNAYRARMVKNALENSICPPLAIAADGNQNVWASCSRCVNGAGMYNEPCESCIDWSNFK
ncbi:MAG: hypothetical protein WCI11_18935 [Candidatus Methylumidiphilus sp.]